MTDEWRQHAACRGLSNTADEMNRWYPSSNNIHPTINHACEVCTVKPECLVAVLDEERREPNHLRFGYRAGLSAKARTKLITEQGGYQRPSRCGTVAGAAVHYREGTPICDACRTANTESKRQQRGRK